MIEHEYMCNNCGIKQDDIEELSLDCKNEQDIQWYSICWNVIISNYDELKKWRGY